MAATNSQQRPNYEQGKLRNQMGTTDMKAMKVPLRDTYFVATHNSRSSHKLKIMDYITYTLFDVLLCSIAKNFFKIYYLTRQIVMFMRAKFTGNA